MHPKQLLQIAPLIILIVLAVFFSGIGRSSIPGTANDSPDVLNRTRAFNVVSVSRDGNQLHLKLKNSYDKTITAFAVSIGPDFAITEEFVFAEVSDPGIKPQGIFSRSYPLPSTTLQKPSFNVTIKAIVLDDGTGDGDVLAFDDIKAKRLGEEIQVRRTVEMLRRFFERSQSDIRQLKGDVATALNASDADTLNRVLQINPTGVINRDSNEPLPDKLKQGLDQGRQSVLRKMSEIDNNDNEVPKLMMVKENYERILTRL